MKPCSHCGIEKRLGSFPRNPKTHDGRKSICKECAKEKRRIKKEIKKKGQISGWIGD